MAATLNWCEDHGTATGSPAKGTTRDGFDSSTNYAVNCNWKTADDTNVTAYSSAPIGPPPDNSYEKYQYLKITGSFTSISSMKWTARGNYEELTSNGDVQQGYVKIMGGVSSVYNTPSRSLNAALMTNFSFQVWAHQGLPVKFSTVGPEGADPTDVLTEDGYTQYLISQLQMTADATINSDIEPSRVVVVWTET